MGNNQEFITMAGVKLAMRGLTTAQICRHGRELAHNLTKQGQPGNAELVRELVERVEKANV